jgi:REP element-mobilizing transposase RayT
MARKPRLHYPGALYHVILRGNARQDIFITDEDRYRFYLFVQEGLERYGHRVLAFCLMTNHIHLAIQVADVPLSRIMQNLTFRYARWFNWRFNKNGHLFQGRYKAVLVDADSYLLELAAYIHLNPVRAKMVKKAEAYEWSSHKAYCSTEQIAWLNTEYILSCFSADHSIACQQFSRYVSERSNDGHRDDFYGKASPDSRVMGEDNFVENILAQNEDIQPCKPTLEQVLAAVMKIYNLKEEELASNGQKRQPSEARSMAAWAVLELTDATLTELAIRMNRDISTMSAAVTRFDKYRQSNTECAKKLEMFRQELNLTILQA